MNWNSICPKFLSHGLNSAKIICAHTVHFVYKSNSRNAIFVCLSPNSFRLRLNPGNSVKNGNSTIKHAQRTLYFNSEIDVTGSIDNIDLGSQPKYGCSSGGDRNSPFLLLLHPVHGSSALMNLPNLMSSSRVEKNSLCRCCFSCIDMRHDTDISNRV